jgi:heme a synthase
MLMISVATVLVRRTGAGDGQPAPTMSTGVTWLVRVLFGTGWLVLYAGTVVTGSGPHAGDVSASRNGLDPRALSQLHTDLVMLLFGLTLAAVLVLRLSGGPPLAQRAATTLLVVEVSQATVGFTQYLTDLPVGLVALHLLGASLMTAAMTWLLVADRERAEGVVPVVQEPPSAEQRIQGHAEEEQAEVHVGPVEQSHRP